MNFMLSEIMKYKYIRYVRYINFVRSDTVTYFTKRQNDVASQNDKVMLYIVIRISIYSFSFHFLFYLFRIEIRTIRISYIQFMYRI